jgi:hypothetical protein
LRAVLGCPPAGDVVSALPDDPFLIRPEDGSSDSWNLALQVGRMFGRALLGLDADEAAGEKAGDDGQ